MKTNQTVEQMINNLLWRCNYNIQVARDNFSRYGCVSSSYSDACSSACESVRVLYCVGIITQKQQDELIHKIIWRKYDEITPFEVDYSCI